MGWMRTVLREVWGLFVDDGSFAVAIVAWVALVWLLERGLRVASVVGGTALFAGLGVILVESLLRYARAKRRSGG
ncbi:MAG: hypothetical protein NVSMB3_10760 [Acidobacteriaceae bacterium]